MKFDKLKFTFGVLSILLITLCSFGQELKHLHDWMQKIVDRSQVTGCMAQVTKDGKTVFLDAYGKRSPESDEELDVSQVVRIYSMSKAITSVAIMQLVEQGIVGIDDPVSKYIPEFKNIKVLDNGNLRPASKEMTVRELLTHTAGIAYDFSASEELKPYYEDAFVGVKSLEEASQIIAGLPLAGDPGSLYLYGLNTDVLGRVVEVASGQEFEAYLKQHIFEPLSMKDTSFTPSSDVVIMPIVNRVIGGTKIDQTHYEKERDVLNPSFQSGGGGLWSTIHDYTQFCMAMEQMGQLNGARILNPETVRFMVQNHLAPNIPAPPFGLGFGLAEPVRTSRGPRGGGRWTWGGAACTYFFIDPYQNITAVFATQQFPFDFALSEKFHEVVLEAMAQQVPTKK